MIDNRQALGRLAWAVLTCGLGAIVFAQEDAPRRAILITPTDVPQIVVPDSADEVTSLAAGELSRYVGRIIGVRPNVVAEAGADRRRGQIHVGWTAVSRRHVGNATAGPEDGFVLRGLGPAGPGEGYRFCIAGPNPRGTLYGVYALLEDHLGCRWVEPGAGGEVVPKRTTLDLSGVDREDAPSLPHRCLRIRHLAEGDSLEDYIDWQAKQRMNYLYWHGCHPEYQDRRKVMEPFHAAGGRLLRFVRQRGFIVDNSSHSFKRFFPDGPVDMSSRASEDHIVSELDDYLDRNPFVDLVGLWLGDGWGGYAKSTPESCPLDFPDARLVTKDLDWRADKPRASVTNTYVDFVNRVQRRLRQKHPNVSLTLIAYNCSLLAPDKVKCADGQQVHVAFRRSYSLGFGDPRSRWNRRQAVELERWLAACPHVVLYEYYQTGNLGSVGRPFPRTIAADLRYLKQVGAGGTASQSRSGLFRSLGPNYYAYAKLSWNVNADVEEVLLDYYRHAYGPAAPAVKRLFDLWEATYNAGGDYFRYDWKVIVPLFTPEVRREMRALATEASRRAATGSQDQRRRADELALVVEALDAFMDYAQTGDLQSEAKASELSRAHPFVAAPLSSLPKAGILHETGR